ncbi:MAG: family 20 glycosylhydrolase [bacterium]|nr:family 20 glycosylhydrolase [bacterium]
MQMRVVLLVMGMVGVHSVSADPAMAERAVAIVPRPAHLKVLSGGFRVLPDTPIAVDVGNAEVRAIGDYLAEVLRQQTGSKHPLIPMSAETHPPAICLTISESADGSTGQESYDLVVAPDRVLLRASRPRGLFLGVQTLRQLFPTEWTESNDRNPSTVPGGTIRCVRITDQPRYRWRGMLLDCCRHFMPKDFVKRYIDLLAYHRMNVLHWHLTEDQGWRIEIKRYPKLTQIGAWRGEGDERHGGYYTQEDIREIVAYAASRYITVVPEIEMPGHSVAALAAHPDLSCTGGPFEVSTHWGVHDDVYCAGNEATFEFIENVLTEVLDLFPSEFIHIGGDECPKVRWKACRKCQARIKAEDLENEDELQSYFIRRVEGFLRKNQRRLVGWDEILEGGLAPNATVQSWRGMNGAIAAAQAGHDVIVSPTTHCYLDYSQARTPGIPMPMGFVDLQTAYSFEPTPKLLTEAQAGHVLGLEGNIWTEFAPPERVDQQVFPRLCALAEVAWTPAERRDWAGFSERLIVHLRRLEAMSVAYFLHPPVCLTTDREFVNAIDVRFENPLGQGEIRYTIDGSEPSAQSAPYLSGIRLEESAEVRARTYLPRGRSTDTVTLHFTKRTPRKPARGSGLAPGLE